MKKKKSIHRTDYSGPLHHMPPAGPMTFAERQRVFCASRDIPEIYASSGEFDGDTSPIYGEGDRTERTRSESNSPNEDTLFPNSESISANGGREMEDEPEMLGCTELGGGFFRDLFGTEGWGDAPVPPPFPSGPVPKSEVGLAARRLQDPEARFWQSVMMAQVMVLPMCVAHNAAERDQLNQEIAQIIGLDTALAKGWISGFTLCWKQGKFPKMPTGIRVQAAPGRRTRSQVLGSLEKEIRDDIDTLMDSDVGDY